VFARELHLMIKNWMRRIRYAYRRHGPGELIWLIGYNFVYLVRKIVKGAPTDDECFDKIHGTETSGIREIGTLDCADLQIARFAVRYHPSSSEWIRTQLEQLALQHEKFTFVDFGSGKGRVILIAAAFPFKEVVGVELSHELHQIALRNIACLPSDYVRAGVVKRLW
jgi:Histone methylation protein DOT1